MRYALLRAIVCAISALAAGVTIGRAADSSLTRTEAFARAAALKAAGEKIFFDASLSASGHVACATCHSPDHAFGPPNALAVQYAGKDGRARGLRAAPSLKYLQVVPQFTEHYIDCEDDGDERRQWAEWRADVGRPRRSRP